MNFTFSLSHNNLVVETRWSGALTSEIISAGIVSHNNWAIKNSDKLPLVLLFDYSQADLTNVTENDLHNIADRFRGLDNLFPDANWVAIMPSDVKYPIVRLWQTFADTFCNNSLVVRNRPEAEKIISSVLTDYSY